MRRVISGYIYTLKIKLHIKKKLETALSSLLYLKHFQNFGARELNLLGNECIVW